MTKRLHTCANYIRLDRNTLLLSCAVAAMASAGFGESSALAQAFQGTPTTADSVTFDRGTPGIETITVGSPTATIDWSPSLQLNGSGNIDFLPAGYVATFQGGADAGNFTVLNRIVPDGTYAIELNGEIYSYLYGSESSGGNIWFYSPGGILVGSTAIIDVGSLLLTTLDVGQGWSADANGFSAGFTAPSGSTSAIQIVDGAQITALQENSYIALVAPRIEQGGSVQVNGAAAFAAAEQLTMTFNQGLFDIVVPVGGGTADANGIVHTGSTGGPASTDGATDPHRVYMVAVPKNQAMMMLLGGDIGFEPATNATVENGEIVLGAGWFTQENSGLKFGTYAGANAGISFGPGNYTSDVDAAAMGDITAIADTGSIVFAADAFLASYFSTVPPFLMLGAENGNSLTVGGDLTLNGIANSGPTNVQVYASGGGDVSVGGTTIIDVSAGAAPANPDLDSTDGHAGSVTIAAYDAGTISLGDTSIFASANGQDNIGNGDGSAGDGYGGSIWLYASGGGAIWVDGNLYGDANGYGGDMFDGALAGGSGYGGYIGLSVYDGSIDVTGSVTLTANGIGGSYLGEGAPEMAQGGLGLGGSVSIWSGGPGSVSLDGLVMLAADAVGGDGQTGGDAYGGNAGVSGVDGTIALGPQVVLSATGTGGDASSGFGGNGGYGQGGRAYVTADAELGNIEVQPSQATISGGNVSLDASGFGGDGGAGDGVSIAAGAGGDASGGFNNGEVQGGAYALAQADGGSLHLGNVTAIADGVGGDGGTGGAGQIGGNGGTAFGGLAQAGGYDPNSTGAVLGSATFADIDLSASGFGGAGGSGLAGTGTGGAGFGGFAVINARGSVDAGNALLAAAGFGGDGGDGGVAAGGDVFVQAYSNSALTFTGDVALDASATGGDGSSGVGGDAFGGYAQTGTNGDGSSLSIAGLNSMSANGIGGAGDTTGGSGYAGNVFFRASGASSASAGSLLANANGVGGAGSSSGGSTAGGSVYVLADSLATMAFGDVVLNALGDGGFVSLNWGGFLVETELALAAAEAPGIMYADNITVVSDGDFAVGDVSFTGSADLTATGMANFYGTLSGPTITVTSADINVALGGSLGVQGITNLITLNAMSDLIYLGGEQGASAPGEYRLSEDGDIESDAAILNAIGSGDGGAPDVNVLDALLEGSQTVGGGIGDVTVNTGGSIIVQGLVEFINAAAEDSLTLNAGNAIQVITDTGGISITDIFGELSGQLTLNAPNIWVASQSIIDQLEIDTNFSGRDNALRTNSGPVNPEGYVRAGTITAEVGETFFVQNSGTADVFAGITAGDGGLTIISTAGQPAGEIAPAAVTEATVFIYGRQEKSDGTIVTNDAFAAEVPVSGNFAAESRINDCPLGGCPPPPPPPPPPEPPELPPALGPESILGPIYLMSSPRLSVLNNNDESNSDSGLESDLIDTSSLSSDEDIDEPVTSGGDAPSQPQ